MRHFNERTEAVWKYSAQLTHGIIILRFYSIKLNKNSKINRPIQLFQLQQLVTDGNTDWFFVLYWVQKFFTKIICIYCSVVLLPRWRIDVVHLCGSIWSSFTEVRCATPVWLVWSHEKWCMYFFFSSMFFLFISSSSFKLQHRVFEALNFFFL